MCVQFSCSFVFLSLSGSLGEKLVFPNLTPKLTHPNPNPNSSTGKTFKINTSSSTKNCVYLSYCVSCNKYVGKTENTIVSRFYQYIKIFFLKKPKHMIPMIAHLIKHGWSEVRVTALEKDPAWSHRQWRCAEARWMEKLSTRAPRGFHEKPSGLSGEDRLSSHLNILLSHVYSKERKKTPRISVCLCECVSFINSRFQVHSHEGQISNNCTEAAWYSKANYLSVCLICTYISVISQWVKCGNMTLL